MQWTPAANDFTGYCISYSTLGGAEVQAGVVDAPATTYLLDGLDSSTNYIIYVRTKSGCDSGDKISSPSIVTVLTSKCMSLADF